MKDIQRIQLELLIKLDEVCQKHNLKYYIAYGTCIGAMRHKGFIPWDHDVDVLMPINDARELEKYQVEFGDRFFLASYRTDENFKSVNMQVIDKTHLCRNKENGKEIISNVAMDIYPFYDCPPSKIGLLMNIWRSHIYKMLVGGPPKNHGGLMAKASKFILAFHPEKNRRRDIERIEKKLNYQGKSKEIADYYGLDITLCSAITYDKEWFRQPTKLEFEGRMFNGPTDPDKYLTKRYGNYMTPPSQKDLEKEIQAELI